MITVFTTESGSKYTIDHNKQTWTRDENMSSPHLRTLSGSYLHISDIQKDRQVFITCQPFKVGSAARLISTTNVVSLYTIE